MIRPEQREVAFTRSTEIKPKCPPTGDITCYDFNDCVTCKSAKLNYLLDEMRQAALVPKKMCTDAYKDGSCAAIKLAGLCTEMDMKAQCARTCGSCACKDKSAASTCNTIKRVKLCAKAAGHNCEHTCELDCEMT